MKAGGLQKIKTMVQGSPRVIIANCYGEHAPSGLAFSGFSVSAFRSLYVSFVLVIAFSLISFRERTPSRLRSQPLVF